MYASLKIRCTHILLMDIATSLPKIKMRNPRGVIVGSAWGKPTFISRGWRVDHRF